MQIGVPKEMKTDEYRVGLVPATTRALVANVHRDLIIRLAAKLRLPAVFSFRFFAKAGGLAAYGSDSIDPHRRAADYIDRHSQRRETGRSSCADTDQV